MWITSHLPSPADREQRNMLDHNGFETRSGTGGDVEPVPVRGVAVEPQRGVGLRQVHMAADLHRTISGVDDGHLELHCAGGDLDIAVAVDDLARDHGIGWWTVTSL